MPGVGALRRRGARRPALGPCAAASGRPLAGEVTAGTTSVGCDPSSSLGVVVVVVDVPLVSATTRHAVSIVTAIIGRGATHTQATKILMHAEHGTAEISGQIHRATPADRQRDRQTATRKLRGVKDGLGNCRALRA